MDQNILTGILYYQLLLTDLEDIEIKSRMRIVIERSQFQRVAYSRWGKPAGVSPSRIDMFVTPDACSFIILIIKIDLFSAAQGPGRGFHRIWKHDT